MIYIVNETTKEFKLFTNSEENDQLKLGSDDCSFIVARLDGITNEVLAALEKNNVVKGKRTTKLFVTKDREVVMYDDSDEIATMFSVDTGLSHTKYKYPKSMIITIIDKECYGDGPIIETVPNHDKPSGISPISTSFVETVDMGSFYINYFFINYNKWDKMDSTSVLLPSGEQLKLDCIEHKKEDKTYRINALIRCDATGNPIVREKKKYNGNTSKPKKVNYKNKKEKAAAHSSLSKSLPKYNNK